MAKGKKAIASLTNRAKQFCALYSDPKSETFGNATQSYLKAGYKTENPSQKSYVMLRQPLVKDYLATLEQSKLEEYNWSRQRYIQEGVDTINALPRSSQVRAKYYEIIGKVQGFFSEAPTSNVLVYNDTEQNTSQNSLKQRLNKLIGKLHNPNSSDSKNS